MALRKILQIGDETLTKTSRRVDNIDKRIIMLLDDLNDTLKDYNGVGIAAPQVGILKRVVLIDIGDGPIELINPELIDTEGAVIDIEGCLSVAGKYGEVERPQKARVKALNRHGEEIIIEGEGLLARALCHELDHLEGKLFVDKVIKYVDINEEDRKKRRAIRKK